ncbi:unnamed protein product [Caenorhabditis bovis]|uniref:Uncharacterized protein n=1 Tax=Caenorhabditis bovis TaxID=2654633 RepID=A0A8S1EZ19_9PELO|nr:unnamed protein product [Caenorhabditis bovis]
MFIPVVKQELEFAVLPRLTDEQAYEQCKTFLPTLRLKIQDLRNMGVLAIEKQKDDKQAEKVGVCRKYNHFYHMKLQHIIQNTIKDLKNDTFTAQSNKIFFTNVHQALLDWKKYSKSPCTKPTKN